MTEHRDSTTRQEKPDIRGRFITLEGIDGCGKSTQAVRLAERPRQAGVSVLETREPGGTEIGKALRAVLLSPHSAGLAPSAELLLFLADRVQHLSELIRPALQRGETVICDRYHDATEAYQRFGRGLDFGPYRGLIDSEVMTTPPDLTLWLDLPPEAAAERMAARRAAQEAPAQDAEARFDTAEMAFHQRVSAGYRALHAEHPARIVRIDAELGIAEMEARIYDQVSARFRV